MPALSFGPFMIPFDRLSFILAIAIFMAATSYLTKRIDPRFSAWGTLSILSFGITARAGHVIRHFETFRDEPWRALNLTDGGFFWPVGLITVVVLTIVMFRKVRLVGWGLAPLGLSAAVFGATLNLAAATPTLPLPADTFERLEGGTSTLPTMTGKPMVINLWATWCPPCRREMPMLAGVAQSTDAAQFIFADQGEERARIETFLKQEDIKLPTVLLDKYGTLTAHYRTPGLPATLFIDSNGELQSVHLGEISKEQLLVKLIEMTSSKATVESIETVQ
jgi:thiol-disulfide isomerase/thioredoxin